MAAFNPVRGRNGSLKGGAGFVSQSAGNKAYGLGGRPNPNQGKAGAAAKTGYTMRDAQRAAILKRRGK